MHTRGIQVCKIYTYGIHAHGTHAHEIHTHKYMSMECTLEVTALIIPKVYLKLVLTVDDRPLGRRGIGGMRWCVMVVPNGSG
jgi:hypothetical protein